MNIKKKGMKKYEKSVSSVYLVTIYGYNKRGKKYKRKRNGKEGEKRNW